MSRQPTLILALLFEIAIFWGIIGPSSAQEIKIAEAVTKNRDARLWHHRNGDSWPQFLGPTANSHSIEKGILKDWSAGKLKVLWHAKTGEGYSIGSIANGRYFHFDVMNGNAVLTCRNVSTGKLIWSYSYKSRYEDIYGYDSGPRSSPLVDDDRVYVLGVEGELHCVSSTDGKKLWSIDTVEAFGVKQNFFGVGSSPVLYQNKLIVMVGGSPDSDQDIPRGQLDRVNSNGTGVVAFNKKTGEELYRTIDDLASYTTPVIAHINGRDRCLVWMRESLFGFDPENGKIDFEFPWRARKFESVNASSPVVKGNQVLLTESYGPGAIVLDLKLNLPKTVWKDGRVRLQSMAAHFNTPVVSGNYFFGSSGQHANGAELRCVDWKTGEVKWSQERFRRASCLLVDNHLVVLGELGSLALVKADPEKYSRVSELDWDQLCWSDGSKCSLAQLRAPCWAAPILSRGHLIIRDKIV